MLVCDRSGALTAVILRSPRNCCINTVLLPEYSQAGVSSDRDSYLSAVTGLLVPKVPEIYLPLKQCIEILGAGLKPRSAQAILDHCLQGLAQKVH